MTDLRNVSQPSIHLLLEPKLNSTYVDFRIRGDDVYDRSFVSFRSSSETVNASNVVHGSLVRGFPLGEGWQVLINCTSIEIINRLTT